MKQKAGPQKGKTNITPGEAGQLMALLAECGAWVKANRGASDCAVFRRFVAGKGSIADRERFRSILLAVGKFVVTDLLPGFVGFAKSFIDSLLEGFDTNLPTLVTDVTNMGKSIIGGIVDGIRNAPESVLSALSSIVDGAINEIKHRLGIASPSTVFAAIGQNMMAGLSSGITDNMQLPQVALNASMGSLVGAGYGGAQSAASYSNSVNMGGVTIYIDGAQDPGAVADEVSRQLQAAGYRSDQLMRMGAYGQ